MSARFAKDVAVFASTWVFAGVLQLSYQIIVARSLGPQDYGLFQSVMGIHGLLIVVGLQLRMITIHCVSVSPDHARQHCWAFFTKWSLFIGLAVAFPVATSATWITPRLHMDSPWPLVALSGFLVVNYLLVSMYAGLQAQGHYATFSIAKISECLIMIAAGTLLLMAGIGVSGAVIGYAVGMGAVSLFLLFRRGASAWDSADYSFREDLSGVIKFLAVYFTVQWVSNAPVIVARMRMPEDGAGIMATLFSLNNLIMPFAYAVTIPLYVRAVAGSSEPKLLPKAVLGVLLPGAGLIGLSLIGANWLIRTIYGESFEPAAEHMTLYSVYLTVHVLAMVMLFYHSAKRQVTLILLLIPWVSIMTIGTRRELSVDTIIHTQIVAWLLYAVAYSVVWLLRRKAR